MLKPSPIIHTTAFIRALVAPLIVWGVAVGVSTWGGQPGVVCITPVAWLLALYSGVEYVRLGGGRGERFPGLAPALLGGLLGLIQGLMFIGVTALGMPVSSPGDVQKAVVLDAIACVGGVVVCAGLASVIAGRALRTANS